MLMEVISVLNTWQGLKKSPEWSGGVGAEL